ncbi:MAG: hypothetical protein MUF06_01210 [Pirellulaceae bacterium]|jgi:hypothetical protein|nr:hypothetical protein [Pirellulaceae bacterium]
MSAREPSIACAGWWEEVGYGRQPMHQLKLRISGSQISGSGTDIVGPFTLQGTISAGGGVAMVKQYLGQHQVDYLGTYDGEGTMFGEWRLGPFSDRWAISFQRPTQRIGVDEDDIQVLDP